MLRNLRFYDSHLIIKHAFEIKSRIGNKKIDGKPNSHERFMTFSIGDLNFIDSAQFMASSLDNLVENLYDSENRYNKMYHETLR